MSRAWIVACVLAAASLRADGIRLVEPRDGVELTGGALATIEWTGDDLPADAEEWEAFLSVDGGRWFSARITPHLDASLRRFTFEVPNVATRDARILLRFGDEKKEVEIAVPARFSIRPDAAAVRTPLVAAATAGEAARPGDRGVAMWVAGARDGSKPRTYVHRTRSLDAAAIFALRVPLSEDLDAAGDAPTLPVLLPLAFAPWRERTRFVPAPLTRGARVVLLATRRLNI